MCACREELELLNSDPRRGKVGIDRGDAWRTSEDHERSCALLLWRRKEGFVVKVFSARKRVEMDGKRMNEIDLYVCMYHTSTCIV